MTCETLWNLRMEISLCSMYYADFRNSFGIDEHAVCDFFDGYANYLQELMNGDEAGRGNNHFFDFLEQYDCPENLWNWYGCFENDPLPREPVDQPALAI